MKKNKYIILILLLGLLARIIFTLFFAKEYFGRDNIFVDADTWAWLRSFINLVENGYYTVNLLNEYGYFGRMPGYSFFLGIIYYLTDQSADLTFPIVAIIQITLDVFCIYLVYLTSLKLNKNHIVSLITGLLYSVYPFVIVWTPVAYSESLSIFFMLLSFNTLISNRNSKYFFSGVLIGIAVLFRPQLAILIPLIVIYITINLYKVGTRRLVKNIIVFGFAFFLIYGSWPIRNYLNHNKIILTQDLRGFPNWNEDVISYMQYVYSVKTEWEPQFSNIIHNKEVKFPSIAYGNKEDSLKLEKAIYLAKTCGSGFSNWRGYWKEPINSENCNNEIKELFDGLRKNQIKSNPYNFYILLPLENLKKAIFKNELYNTFGIRKYASYLFYLRTFFILLGFLGGYILIRKKRNEWLIILAYPVLLYLTLTFGTGVQYRNIEVRYFLPADILLLFPASFILYKYGTLFGSIIKRRLKR